MEIVVLWYQSSALYEYEFSCGHCCKLFGGGRLLCHALLESIKPRMKIKDIMENKLIVQNQDWNKIPISQTVLKVYESTLLILY